MFRSIRTKRLRVNRSHLKCYPTFGSREDSSKLLLSSHTARPARSRERTVAIRETMLPLKIYTIFSRFATALSHTQTGPAAREDSSDLLLSSRTSRPARERERVSSDSLASPDRFGFAGGNSDDYDSDFQFPNSSFAHPDRFGFAGGSSDDYDSDNFHFLNHLSHTQTGSDLRAVV